MEEKRYTAFISYRHVEPDRTVAIRLHRLLETYHIPRTVQSVTGRKALGRVFRDEEELPLATDLSDSIELALSESEWLVVVCSPALLTSNWCMKEIDAFIRQGKRDHILLVLAAGTPETSFPPQVMTATVDGTEVPVEPLAANVAAPTVRESLKKLEIEKLRLIARILGVNFDDLRRRARRRRLRIAAAITAGVLALSAFTGVLVYRAAQERKKAAEQAEKAEQERLNAEKQAELAAQKEREALLEQIAKNIEKMSSLLSEEERLSAVRLGQETLALSEQADGARREEILNLIRRGCYGEAFSPLASIDTKNLALRYLTVSPDGSSLLGISNTNTVTLLDVVSGETRFSFAPSERQSLEPRFSPDGSRFLANCDNGSCAYVWNTADCSLAEEIHGDSGSFYEVQSAEFIGDSDHVLVHDDDRVYIYDLTDRSCTLIHTLGSIDCGYDPTKSLHYEIFGGEPEITVHIEHLDTVLASPDGSKILIGADDGRDGVFLIDREGKYLCTLDRLAGVTGDSFTFSPDGSLVACSGLFGIFGMWDANTGELLWAFLAQNDISPFAFSPNSRYASFAVDSVFHEVEARTNKSVFGGRIDGEEELGIRLTPGIRYSPDGKHILLSNQSLFVLDAASGTLLKRFTEERYHYAYSAFSENGKYLVLAEPGGTVSVLRTEENSTVRNLVGGTADYVSPPSQSPDGFSATLESTHELSDAVKSYTPETERYATLCASPDGKYAALLHADGAIELFEPGESGAVKYFLAEFGARATAAGFGGRYFAAADWEGRVLLFDLEAGETVIVYREPGAVGSFCFSEDGELLLAADLAGTTVSAFPTDGGKKLFSMTGDAAQITGMGFTEDGKCAVAEYDGGVILAELLRTEEELLTFAALLSD